MLAAMRYYFARDVIAIAASIAIAECCHYAYAMSFRYFATCYADGHAAFRRHFAMMLSSLILRRFIDSFIDAT